MQVGAKITFVQLPKQHKFSLEYKSLEQNGAIS